MGADQPFYFGNAARDQVRGTGWFVGQFVATASGLRHQTEVELKWGIHPDGERRSHGPGAVGNATTIAILIRGGLRVTFDVGGTRHIVTMQNEGDYVIFGPEVVHFWEAIGDTLVVTVRFPSIEVKGSGDERRPTHAR